MQSKRGGGETDKLHVYPPCPRCRLFEAFHVPNNIVFLYTTISTATSAVVTDATITPDCRCHFPIHTPLVAVLSKRLPHIGHIRSPLHDDRESSVFMTGLSLKLRRSSSADSTVSAAEIPSFAGLMLSPALARPGFRLHHLSPGSIVAGLEV